MLGYNPCWSFVTGVFERHDKLRSDLSRLDPVDAGLDVVGIAAEFYPPAWPVAWAADAYASFRSIINLAYKAGEEKYFNHPRSEIRGLSTDQ